MRIQKISLIMLILVMLILPGMAIAQDGADNIKTLYIDSEIVECRGEEEPPCLLVRENPEDNYELWFDTIDGFTFVPGFEYEIKVESQEQEDGSSAYSLTELVSLTPTEETLAAEFENEMTLFVSDEAVACPADPEQTCLLVRENEDDNFRLLEEPILGFDYTIGQVYEIRVLKIDGETEETPSTYLLLEILSPEVDSTETDTTPTETSTDEVDGTNTVLSEAQTIEIGELQIEIRVPEGFISTDLKDTGAPMYAFAADSTIMENYLLRPEAVSEFVIISINLTTQQLLDNDIDTSSLGTVIFDLAFTDTQLGDPESLVIDGGEAVTYPFRNPSSNKVGAFTLIKFVDNYLLLQGSASVTKWPDNEALYQEVINSIRQVEE